MSLRPFSLYLDDVKQSLAKSYDCDLAGSTPPLPDRLPETLKFETNESRRSETVRDVVSQIASLAGAKPEEILITIGSSSAYLNALSAVTKPGDVVVIETPTYEPLVKTARFLGLKVKRVARTGEFERDLSNFKKSRGKVLVLSNPNNPTGWLYSKDEIKKIARLYDYVIVDEISLPVFANEASRVGDAKNVISLSGLSKSLGLSSLRVGWLRASKKIIRAADQMGLNSYCDVPTLPLVATHAVLPRWNEIVEAHRSRANANRDVVHTFDQRHTGVLSHDFSEGHFGTLTIPKKFKSAESFAKELAKKHSIKVAAGESFDLAKAVRISLWPEPKKFAKALEAIESYY